MLGGARKTGGRGPCKFRIGFGAAQVNSALDLGGVMSIPHTWKKARNAIFPTHYLFIK